MTHTNDPVHTLGGTGLTDLILAVFQLNGRLLNAGDRLVASLGLTSARWQVLGAVAMAHTPQPVAHIARDMGLTRQAVQRVVNALEAEGFVAFVPNPHHQRAKLVALTKAGAKAFAAATQRQTPWANDLARGFAARDLRTALAVVREFSARLDQRAG